MAIISVKENVRLKLELDGGTVGNKQITKTKTFSKVKPSSADEDIYLVGESLADLQTLPLSKVKRLEEIYLRQE